MMRIITLVTMLVGLGSTLCEGEVEIWLNELLITYDAGGAHTLQVELAGRPAITDFPVQPTCLEAIVQFYSGTDGEAGAPLTVTLTADADWAGNYASGADGTTCTGTGTGGGCSAATGDVSTTNGLWLTYTKVDGTPATTVYCWGDDTGDVGGVGCDETVSDATSVPGDGSFIDWALYGADEDDWDFADSKKDGGTEPFATIGDLNKCPEGADQCVDGLVDQGIDDFEYTPPSENDDAVWLNELNVNSDAAEVDLEIVGAPEGVGEEPSTIPVDVTFYSATTVVTTIPVEMSTSDNDGWNGHYQGKEAVADVADAFPAGTELGGLQLSWGAEADDKAVYCWGTNANLESSIGTDDGGGLKCQNIVKTATMRGVNRALYNWEQGTEGTPEDGGKKANHFYWTDSSKTGGGSFATIGKANKCEATDCIPDDQVLAKYEWGGTPSTPTDTSVSGVWLNELKVSRSGQVYSLDIELVGEPPMEYPTPPEDIKVAVEFFSANTAAGGGQVTLVPDDTDWRGQYVKAWQCAADCTEAGKPDTLLGVKLTYDWGSKVYCWGDGAREGVEIGPDDDECEIPIAEYAAPEDTKFVDHGLYGDTHGEWAWKISKTTTTEFATLGIPNECTEALSDPKPADCAGTDLVQAIADYKYDVPANTNADEVWLNEVFITVASGTVTAKLEIVGGVASATNVEVTFYLGNTQVAEATEMKTDLIKSDDEKWNSHYVGTVDVLAEVGSAFPSGDELAGLQLKWGEKTSVYCWGSTAEIDNTLGVDNKQCKTIVKTGGPIRGGEGEYNRALFNWEDTPDDGGSKVADFYWTDSKKGDSVINTIGEVNTCPAVGEGECIPTDQKLAVNADPPVQEKPSSSSTTTASSSVSLFVGSWGLIYAVVGLGVITVMQCE